MPPIIFLCPRGIPRSSAIKHEIRSYARVKYAFNSELSFVLSERYVLYYIINIEKKTKAMICDKRSII